MTTHVLPACMFCYYEYNLDQSMGKFIHWSEINKDCYPTNTTYCGNILTAVGIVLLQCLCCWSVLNYQ